MYIQHKVKIYTDRALCGSAQVLMNLASIVERADEQVLPAVYHFISKSLHATPSQLGALTLCRAMVQVSHQCTTPVTGTGSVCGSVCGR